MAEERTKIVNSDDIERIIVEETIKIHQEPAVIEEVEEQQTFSPVEYTDEQRKRNREALKKLHPDIAWAKGISEKE